MSAHPLILITAETHHVELQLAYATDDNFTGKTIYRAAHCLLLTQAETALRKAVVIARQAGYTLRIFDAYRPPQAQQALWDFLPDDRYVANPQRGSNHSRGAAIDLTLVDTASGQALNMGTGFDDMTPASRHFHEGLPEAAQRNRLLLLGIMYVAGFAFIPGEWWHYELPGSRALPTIDDGEGHPLRLM